MSKLRRTLQITLPVVILGLGAAAAVGLASLREEPKVVPPEAFVPLVRTVPAERADVVLEVRAHGTVEPRTETLLRAEVGAKVVRLAPSFESGGFFEEGDVLVQLDPTDLRVALEESRARVARAELALAQEQADADVARADWGALGREQEPGELALREPQLASARAELAAAHAAEAKALLDVERCTVRAPYRGRVVERRVDVGQLVERGGELATLYAVDFAEIRLPIADEDLARLEPGVIRGRFDGDSPEVRIETRFAGELHAWPGRLVRTEGRIDPQSRAVVLVARVDDPYGLDETTARPPLVAGLFVEGIVEGRSVVDAVVVPRSALQAGNRVFALADGRLSIRDVTVLQGGTERAVLAAGVVAGERLVVSPLELPVEGMQLRDQEANP